MHFRQSAEFCHRGHIQLSAVWSVTFSLRIATRPLAPCLALWGRQRTGRHQAVRASVALLAKSTHYISQVASSFHKRCQHIIFAELEHGISEAILYILYLHSKPFLPVQLFDFQFLPPSFSQIQIFPRLHRTDCPSLLNQKLMVKRKPEATILRY